MAAKLKVGDTLVNSRVALKVTSTSAGKDEFNRELITCICGKCNRESTYLKKAFINETISACKICSKQANKKIDKLKLEPGDKINNVTIDKIDTVGNSIRLQFTCNICKKQHKVYKDSADKISKSEIRCNCEDFKKGKKQIGLIEGYHTDNEPKLMRKKAAVALKPDNIFQREIPGFRYIGSSVQGVKSVSFSYQCLDCLSIINIPEGRVTAGNCDITCKRCKELKDNNSITLTKMDWVGYINNCRRVQRVYTSDSNIKMCEVQCIICGSTEKMPLATFISDQTLICKECSTNILKLRCPICGEAHIKTSIKALYNTNNSGYTCTTTGKKIDKEDLISDHEFEIEKQYIKSKYSGKYNFARRIKGRNGIANMIVFDSGYTGTNGEFYNNCMCIEHNKFMSLSDSELQKYMHEYCMETRMMPYNQNGKLV